MSLDPSISLIVYKDGNLFSYDDPQSYVIDEAREKGRKILYHHSLIYRMELSKEIWSIYIY